MKSNNIRSTVGKGQKLGTKVIRPKKGGKYKRNIPIGFSDLKYSDIECFNSWFN